MYWDGHVHMGSPPGTPAMFAEGLERAGVEGALLISSAPDSAAWRERLREVMDWAGALPRVAPFLWIDPLAADSGEQVETAAAAGIAGFKCICTACSPGDERPLALWAAVARLDKPILFHTGILIGPADSRHCRPLRYEALVGVPGLRFCLAHAGWPWSDECVALFMKWRNCVKQGRSTAEMYLDATPGSPGAHRERMLEGLFHAGLGAEDRIHFGTDLRTGYDVDALALHRERDEAILRKLGVTESQRRNYFSGNLLRFVHGDQARP